MRALLLFSFLFCVSDLFSQDFTAVDAHARKVPATAQDVNALAAALTKDCQTEKEKVRAFYVWITQNIAYDVSTFQLIKEHKMGNNHDLQLPEQVLQNKRAVCEGYSNLFSALCKASGIESFVVTGFVKNGKGMVARIAHGWNVVRADGQWGLVDATWGAGDVDTDEGTYTPNFREEYFLSAPEKLIADHYPHDPIFQLLSKPLTFEAFKTNTMPAADLPPYKAYSHIADTLSTILSRDTMMNFYCAGRRSLKLNPESNYGVWQMSMYHSSRANAAMKQYAEASEKQASNKTPLTLEWLNTQVATVQLGYDQLSSCVSICSKSATTDVFTPNIRVMRTQADKLMPMFKKELDRLKVYQDKFK